MSNDVNIEQIHRYLSGEMEVTEREAFEAAMEKDEALQEAVRFEQQLLGAIEQSFDQQARQDIGQVHRQLQSQGFFEAPRSMRRIALRVAAAAAVIALGIGIWWFALKPPAFDPALAFSQYFQPDSTEVDGIIESLTSVGFTPEMNRSDSLREALLLYRAGNHQQASGFLEIFLRDHPQNDTARFYLALAELSLSQYEPAAERLSGLARADGFGQQKQAQWYLALCYLRMANGLNPARQVLEKLAEDESFDKQAEARELLEKLPQ